MTYLILTHGAVDCVTSDRRDVEDAKKEYGRSAVRVWNFASWDAAEAAAQWVRELGTGFRI